MKVLISIVAVVFTALQTSAVKLQMPVNRTPGANTQVFFTSEARDPATWTLFLMDPAQAFRLYAILGRQIDPTPGVVNVTLPATLKSGTGTNYILKAVQDDWVDRVYGTSPIFTLAA